MPEDRDMHTAPHLAYRRRTVLAGAAALLAAPALLRAQQAYPSRPIRLIAPSTPGSGVDLAARALSIPLSASLGQPIVVENVGGQGGVIGTNQIVRAPKDGYTVGVVSSNYSISPYAYKLSYDPLKDVVPVAIISTSPNVLLVSPKLPVKTLAELLALAKSRGRDASLSFGSAGVGSAPHLNAALLMMMGGVEMLHVPYKGVTYTTDLIAGQIDVAFLPLTAAMSLVRSGSLRALAVTTTYRASALPDVPTIAEAGLPGYEGAGWNAAIVAAGTPGPIIERLNTEILSALRTPELIKFAEIQGARLVGGTLEESRRWFAREIAANGKIAQRIGLKPEG